jgi:hypothetical protein
MKEKQTTLLNWLQGSVICEMKNKTNTMDQKGMSYVEAISLDSDDKENSPSPSNVATLPPYKHEGTHGMWHGAGGTPFREACEGKPSPVTLSSHESMKSSPSSSSTMMFGGVPLVAGRGLTHDDVVEIRQSYNMRAQDKHLQSGMVENIAAKEAKHKYAIKSNSNLKSQRTPSPKFEVDFEPMTQKPKMPYGTRTHSMATASTSTTSS